MEIKNLSLKFGEKVLYSNFNFQIENGKITCILGKSGCGKTSLLNCIARQIDCQGEIVGAGKISFVFQTPRLIPRISIRKNLEFVIDSLSKDEKKRKVDSVAEQFECKEILDKFPDQISGGEGARVAVARAFCSSSQTILLDEPFENIDIRLKSQIIEQLLFSIAQDKKTALCVSHNVEDILLMADRVVVFGGQPNEIVLDKQIAIPQNQRKFGDKQMASLREEIYSCLMSL
ncbi:MAG: ATP-binding cassette domain-containing protein [Clostridia bacterium]